MTKHYPVAILSSDNHLQRRTWTSRPELELDAMWAFDYMTSYARKMQIPNIILAGDVIDKQKNEAEIANFLRVQLKRCSDNNVQVYYTQGQHELQDQPWLSALDSMAVHLHDDSWPVGPFEVYGIDWTPLDQLQDCLDEVPESTDLLCMHQVTQEWMGGICSPELDWPQVPHASMLLIGDYHGKHGRFERKGAQGQPLSVFCPGSQAMQAIDEPVIKRFFVLYDDGTTRSVNIPGRPVLAPPPLLTESDVDLFVERAATQINDAHTAASEIAEGEMWDDLYKPIVYVKFLNTVPDAYSRIRKAVGDAAFLFFKELLPATPEDSPEAQERKQVIQGGLLGALATVVPDETSEVFQVSHRLLSSPSPLAALAELREEYLGSPED